MSGFGWRAEVGMGVGQGFSQSTLGATVLLGGLDMVPGTSQDFSLGAPGAANWLEC